MILDSFFDDAIVYLAPEKKGKRREKNVGCFYSSESSGVTKKRKKVKDTFLIILPNPSKSIRDFLLDAR